MGFFVDDQAGPRHIRASADDALLHRMECRVCPLNEVASNAHPHMAPSGAEKPLVYFLGEAPGQTEDKEGVQFVGDSGKLLRSHIPPEMRKRVRYNNVVRTHPPRNRDPTRIEIECCRPSVTRDIEQSEPAAIVGFGNVPLGWVSKMSGVTMWRGRRMPVRVGAHVCWYYPMLHPSYLLRQRRGGRRGADVGGSEDERMFGFDLARVWDDLKLGLPPPVVHTADDARSGVEIVTEGGRRGLKQVRDALDWAASLDVVGVDYETNCLRPYAANAQLLSAAVGSPDRAVAFPFGHPGSAWSPEDINELFDLWVKFLSAPKVRRASHNLAFELEWTAWFFGPDAIRAGRWEDTATQASILDERRGRSRPGPFSLEWLVQQYFGFNLKLLSGLDRKRLAAAPLEAVLYYNGMDAKYHAGLYHAQNARIRAEGLGAAYWLGLRRVPTVVLTQMKGVPVDQVEVARLQKKYDARIRDIRRDIGALPIATKFRQKYSQNFNPLSNKDVLRVFHGMLKRPECLVKDKYTKEFKKSADEAVLSKIDHPLSRLVLDLRKSTKRKSTYVDPLAKGSPTLYPDGLLHAQFNTIFTETGRLSAESPNLQNFPKRDDEAVEVRKPIKAAKGDVILSFDYGQIEARVIAMFTRDVRFCRALWDRYDIHWDWAERVARAHPRRIGGARFFKDKKVMKDLRTDIKNQWTFPLIFGAQVPSAAGYLGIPEDVTRELFDEFWEEFSGVASWQGKQIEFYNQHGYVECLTGRRRRGPLSVNKVLNSPIQGTAAEIVMDGMCRLSEVGDPELQPEINIHDDLTFLRVPANRVDDVTEKVLDHMLEVPFDWVNVPITVEVACGLDWMNMEEIGAFSSDEWFGDKRPDEYKA